MEDDDIIVIDAEPTSHSLPPSTSATAVDLSFLREDDDVDSTFLSLSPPFSQDSAEYCKRRRTHPYSAPLVVKILHPAHKRCLFQESGEEKFFKKIKVTKDSTPEEGHWITKPLTKSDVNGCSRLLLPRRELKNYVLPFMDEEQQYTICNDSCRIDVTVFDVDTQTEHSLTFKKWSSDIFLLSKVWTPEFVKRRNLKEDDV
ncbi:hypothetical protein BC332_00923 [Capsicum chinense]|nr:hypothetical protein BC332_00923 [Capsicum chinense]